MTGYCSTGMVKKHTVDEEQKTIINTNRGVN